MPVEDIRRLADTRRGGYRDNGYGNGYGRGDSNGGYNGNGYRDQQNGYSGGYQNGSAPQRNGAQGNGNGNGAGKPAAQPLNDPVKLRVPESVMARHSDAKAMLYHLTDMMSLFPGSRDVLVYLPGQKPVRCSQSSRIDFTDELRARLVKLLGEENVKG